MTPLFSVIDINVRVQEKIWKPTVCIHSELSSLSAYLFLSEWIETYSCFGSIMVCFFFEKRKFRIHFVCNFCSALWILISKSWNWINLDFLTIWRRFQKGVVTKKGRLFKRGTDNLLYKCTIFSYKFKWFCATINSSYPLICTHTCVPGVRNASYDALRMS